MGDTADYIRYMHSIGACNAEGEFRDDDIPDYEDDDTDYFHEYLFEPIERLAEVDISVIEAVLGESDMTAKLAGIITTARQIVKEREAEL
jgi:hypothetical protein